MREVQFTRDGMYVRVNGHLKNFQSTRQLGGVSVRLATREKESGFVLCVKPDTSVSKTLLGWQAMRKKTTSMNLITTQTLMRSAHEIFQRQRPLHNLVLQAIVATLNHQESPPPTEKWVLLPPKSLSTAKRMLMMVFHLINIPSFYPPLQCPFVLMIRQ